jgi:hypothetical protein
VGVQLNFIQICGVLDFFYRALNDIALPASIHMITVRLFSNLTNVIAQNTLEDTSMGRSVLQDLLAVHVLKLGTLRKSVHKILAAVRVREKRNCYELISS